MTTELSIPSNPVSPSDERRLQILMAGANLFAQHGFHATGMRQICEAVQLSPGALYRYFASKDEIILGLIDLDQQRTAEWFSNLPLKDGLMACLEKLTELSRLDFTTDTLITMWSEIRAEAARNPVVREKVEAHYQFAEKLLTQLIEEARLSGNVWPDVDPQAAAVFIMSGYEGLMVRRSVVPDFDYDVSSAQLLHFIADALGTRRPCLTRRAVS